MRIVFDYQIFSLQQFGGISRYFIELATLLPELFREFETTVVAPYHVNEYLAQAEVAKIGRKIPLFSGKHRVLPLFNRLATRSFIRTLQPDLIHETYYTVKGIDGQCPRILTVYDMLHERYPELFAGVDRQVPDLKASAVKRATHIITISDNTRDDVIRFLDVDPEKITVIPLASSLGSPEKKYENQKPYFLYVGLREGVKNFETLLTAYAQSSVLNPDFDLLCVGGGQFTPREADRIKTLGLNGHVKQLNADDSVLASLFAGAELFVYPSLYEGFGIPLLEAMRCGCPIACSNTSCLPEVAGDAAVFFDPFDPEDIRSSLESIIDSPELAEMLRRKGYEQEKKYTWKKCAEQTAKVYLRFART